MLWTVSGKSIPSPIRSSSSLQFPFAFNTIILIKWTVKNRVCWAVYCVIYCHSDTATAVYHCSLCFSYYIWEHGFVVFLKFARFNKKTETVSMYKFMCMIWRQIASISDRFQMLGKTQRKRASLKCENNSYEIFIEM